MTTVNVTSDITNAPMVDAKISFRFLALDKFQAYSMVREIIGSSHAENTDTKRYVCCVPLSVKNFEDINDYFIRQRIAITDCDILVSVSASVNNGIVDIPAIVNRMLKYIDCKLTFAYTVS
ncbi:hypothetical protein [Colwellia echini]|uniref:Uncharacterized protein n=1 Tax=Colwellia echini TaxID=1982103 RepID=A0ABY3N0N5_9GAMM|nr:hypothetical protein [Colwellia echini]TYK66879.1 hypothetical protein CWS31_003600 [Colwellia echini]